MNGLDLDELILQIHGAALEADGWGRLGRVLLQVISAEKGIGLRVSSQECPEPWALLLDFDPSAAQSYAQQWAQHDLWYTEALKNRLLETGRVNVGSQLVGDGEFRCSIFFNDYLKPLDIRHMVQVCLSGTQPAGTFGRRAVLSMFRGPDRPPFSSEDVRLLSTLAPHLTVAARNCWSALHLRLLTGARASALDAVSSAVYAVDRSGRLIFANRLGEEFISHGRWVQVSGGILKPSPTIVRPNHFLAELRRASTGIGSTLLLHDSVVGAEAQVSIAPVTPDVDLGIVHSCPSVLVWITPLALRKDSGRDMALLFGLTHAERRILDRLIAGTDLREAAGGLGISIHTARAQLKSVLRKTGRRTQGQLLMLAARVAALSSAGA